MPSKLPSIDLDIERLISDALVGDCPNCGSDNTHNCAKAQFVPGPPTEPKPVMVMGASCEVAKRLDDPTIGHCGDCEHIWCLECGSEIDDTICGHWAVCDECMEEQGYLTLDEIIDKVCPMCEHWDDGCQLENPSECEKTKPYECPYEFDVSQCPTIKAVSNNKR